MSKKEAIDETFKHYRTSASIFSATVIVLAIYALVSMEKTKEWVKSGEVERIAFFAILVSAALASILLGVLVQYFIFRGYYVKAQEDAEQETAEESNVIFRKADDITKWVLILFFIWVFAAVILYIVSLFT